MKILREIFPLEISRKYIIFYFHIRFLYLMELQENFESADRI